MRKRGVPRGTPNNSASLGSAAVASTSSSACAISIPKSCSKVPNILCNNPANQLYDPLNGNAPFANNKITEPIDPVAQALFASPLYPSPAGSGLQNNATYTTVSKLNNNQYDIKIDFNASSKDHLFGRYSHAN